MNGVRMGGGSRSSNNFRSSRSIPIRPKFMYSTNTHNIMVKICDLNNCKLPKPEFACYQQPPATLELAYDLWGMQCTGTYLGPCWWEARAVLTAGLWLSTTHWCLSLSLAHSHTRPRPSETRHRPSGRPWRPPCAASPAVLVTCEIR